MKTLLLLLTMSILTAACEKDETTVDEYFYFGTSHGMCANDCAKFYQLTDGKVYADNVTRYNGKVTFQSTPLADSAYQMAVNIQKNFPEYLGNRPDTTFGCPDCADQGAIHIERKRNGVVQTWHIDTNSNNQPAEIRGYIIELLATMARLP